MKPHYITIIDQARGNTQMTCDPTFWDFALTAAIVIAAWELTQVLLGVVARRLIG